MRAFAFFVAIAWRSHVEPDRSRAERGNDNPPPGVVASYTLG